MTAVYNHLGSHDMRNLTIASIHTYYVIAGATPILVHNVNTPLTGVCVPRGEPVYDIPPGHSNGVGAGSPIPARILRNYNIGVNADPALPTPMCSYCRTNLAQAVDHVEPRDFLGDLEDANITPTCVPCNSSKRNWMVPYNAPAGYVGAWPPRWWPARMIQEWTLLHAGRG